MNNSRRTAVMVGGLFVVGTAAGVSSLACAGAILGSPDYLAKAAASQNAVMLGALFVLIMGFALAMVPVLMFPLFKKHDEALAMAYVVFRGALETVTYIALAICWLVLAGVGREFATEGAAAASGLQAVGAAVHKAAESSRLLTVFVFSLGALTFYWLLYRSKLIPRWMSLWGFLAIALQLATGFLELFSVISSSSAVLTAMNIPIFLQEMVMAAWMMIKGFSQTE